MHSQNKEFRCGRCGNCCKWAGYVRLIPGEVERIARFLTLSPEEFVEDHTRLTEDRRCLSLLEKADGSCMFFAENPIRCLIDEVKPQQCRDFPTKWNFQGWEKECAGVFVEPEE